MRQNFFEVIGMADVERVHSQMLAWIFESTVLAAARKSEILSELTGQAGEYAVLRVSTEHDHIDVLIETEAAVIAIENKIKITEHDEQLARYEESLADHVLPRRYVYLSLLPEAITNSHWTVKSYGELHSALVRHVFASPRDFDEHAFNEYVEAVSHLAGVVALFDADHRQFTNVFTDGGRTKRDKRIRVSAYTTPQNYVRSNQLETALQRHFLEKIRSQILPSSGTSRISETRGVALLHVVVASRSIRGMIFEWAVQFQGNAVKLNCYARDYEKSRCDQLPAEVMADFKALRTEQGLRGPNPGRTKAYVSLSKKLDFAWSDTFAKIVEAHASAYAELSALGRSMARAHGVEVKSLPNPSAPIQT
jgi:hypothetical protein